MNPWLSFFIGVAIGAIFLLTIIVAWALWEERQWNRQFDRIEASTRRRNQATPLTTPLDTWQQRFEEARRQGEIDRHAAEHPNCEADWTHEHYHPFGCECDECGSPCCNFHLPE